MGIMLRCSMLPRREPPRMLIFAARRIIQAIPILLGVSLVVFGLVHIVPGNPIDLLMPPEASPEVIAQMKAAFGFDKPLYHAIPALARPGASRRFRPVGVQRNTRCGANLSPHSATPSSSRSSLPMLGFTLGIVFGLLAAMFMGAGQTSCSPPSRPPASACRITGAPSCWCSPAPCCTTGCRRRAWAMIRCRCTTGWSISCCRW